MNEVVKAIIHYMDKILVLTRPSNARLFPSSLDLPGGVVEEGETPKDAIIREVFEETKIKIKKLVPIRAWSFNLDEDGTLITGNTFYCRVDDPDVELSIEHEKFEWVCVDDIYSPQYPRWLQRDVELVPLVNCI